MNCKKSIGKYSFKTFILVIGILLVSFGAASAQDSQPAKIKVSADEAKAVKKIESGKTLDEKIKATEEFIKKYPQSAARNQAAGYLAAQIMQLKDDQQLARSGETYLTIFTDPAEADIILPSLIYSYAALKRYKDAFAAADKYLSRHPEDVATRLQLAVEGSNLLRGGTKDFVPASREYATKAIELIEANKKPADVADDRWKEFQTQWLPQLYFSLGIFDYQEGNRAKARVNFEKATKLDSGEVNSWIFLATMADDEYQEVAQKYNISSPGAGRDELLKQANAKLDQLIELYARIVALTDGRPEAKQINEQVRENLEKYYKYRHPDSPDGLQSLINKYKLGS